MQSITATYSPEDNKLRLKPALRLDGDTYARVKAAGFAWAPRQEIFVAPMWTPEREALCLELAGDLEDEDTALVDRAEERAERFEGYEERRAADAARAHAAVESLTQGIPLGQPILVGHHSQRHAERDQQRIENGMRKAVRAFETSVYWKRRAAGALANAKYKERPDVRHRRIKGLEADARKFRKDIEEHTAAIRLWSKVPRVEWDKQTALATGIAARTSIGGYGLYSALHDGQMHGDTAWRRAIAHCERVIAWRQRWLDHTENRLTYERAMLGESGGLAADKFDIAIGGRVKTGGEWVTVLRVNRKDGRINSVTTNRRYVGKVGIEEISDYQPPSAEAAERTKAATKLAPMCNYGHESFHRMTKAEWDAMHTDYKGSVELGHGASGDKFGRVPLAGFEAYGRHRVRSAVVHSSLRPVFLTDAKVTLPPPSDGQAKPKVDGPERDPDAKPRTYTAPEPNVFDAMKASLKAGVQTVTAPQLFPTPPHLAERMVDMLGLIDGDRVLEPSFGTLRLVQALRSTGKTMHIVGVEINQQLCRAAYPIQEAGCTSEFPQSLEVICGDFLQPLVMGEFDAIVMNPPFENGADIKHIAKAMQLLKEGGRLVALCANGPRQNEKLRPIVEACGGIWEVLPEGTFAAAGTQVRTVLLSVSN